MHVLREILALLNGTAGGVMVMCWLSNLTSVMCQRN